MASERLLLVDSFSGVPKVFKIVIIIMMSEHEVDKWVPTSGDGKIPRTAGWLGILSYDEEDDESNKSVSNPCQTLFL